jgi:hypothetical protein
MKSIDQYLELELLVTLLRLPNECDDLPHGGAVVDLLLVASHAHAVVFLHSENVVRDQRGA